MPIILEHWITREMVRSRPDHIFIFGDNAKRYGMGGQAGAMRGEPNTIGIATKWGPGRQSFDYFSDSHLQKAALVIDADIAKVAAQLRQGKLVVFPVDGFGTGRAELRDRAPKVWDHLQQRLCELVAIEAET
jgi:hypothetical protein